MKIGRNSLAFVLASLATAGWLVIPGSLQAQGLPPSYVAAADVYKLVAENDQFRVILATWKPGQRDAWHSHASPLLSYRLTDCKARVHTPDGKFRDASRDAGTVSFSPTSIASHSFENVGTAECRDLIVERK